MRLTEQEIRLHEEAKHQFEEQQEAIRNRYNPSWEEDNVELDSGDADTEETEESNETEEVGDSEITNNGIIETFKAGNKEVYILNYGKCKISDPNFIVRFKRDFVPTNNEANSRFNQEYKLKIFYLKKVLYETNNSQNNNINGNFIHFEIDEEVLKGIKLQKVTKKLKLKAILFKNNNKISIKKLEIPVRKLEFEKIENNKINPSHSIMGVNKVLTNEYIGILNTNLLTEQELKDNISFELKLDRNIIETLNSIDSNKKIIFKITKGGMEFLLDQNKDVTIKAIIKNNNDTDKVIPEKKHKITKNDLKEIYKNTYLKDKTELAKNCSCFLSNNRNERIEIINYENFVEENSFFKVEIQLPNDTILTNEHFILLEFKDSGYKLLFLNQKIKNKNDIKEKLKKEYSDLIIYEFIGRITQIFNINNNLFDKNSQLEIKIGILPYNTDDEHEIKEYLKDYIFNKLTIPFHKEKTETNDNQIVNLTNIEIEHKLEDKPIYFGIDFDYTIKLKELNIEQLKKKGITNYDLESYIQFEEHKPNNQKVFINKNIEIDKLETNYQIKTKIDNFTYNGKKIIIISRLKLKAENGNIIEEKESETDTQEELKIIKIKDIEIAKEHKMDFSFWEFFHGSYFLNLKTNFKKYKDDTFKENYVILLNFNNQFEIVLSKDKIQDVEPEGQIAKIYQEKIFKVKDEEISFKLKDEILEHLNNSQDLSILAKVKYIPTDKTISQTEISIKNKNVPKLNEKNENTSLLIYNGKEKVKLGQKYRYNLSLSMAELNKIPHGRNFEYRLVSYIKKNDSQITNIYDSGDYKAININELDHKINTYFSPRFFEEGNVTIISELYLKEDQKEHKASTISNTISLEKSDIKIKDFFVKNKKTLLSKEHIGEILTEKKFEIVLTEIPDEFNRDYFFFIKINNLILSNRLKNRFQDYSIFQISNPELNTQDSKIIIHLTQEYLDQLSKIILNENKDEIKVTIDLILNKNIDNLQSIQEKSVSQKTLDLDYKYKIESFTIKEEASTKAFVIELNEKNLPDYVTPYIEIKWENSCQLILHPNPSIYCSEKKNHFFRLSPQNFKNLQMKIKNKKVEIIAGLKINKLSYIAKKLDEKSYEKLDMDKDFEKKIQLLKEIFFNFDKLNFGKHTLITDSDKVFLKSISDNFKKLNNISTEEEDFSFAKTFQDLITSKENLIKNEVVVFDMYKITSNNSGIVKGARELEDINSKLNTFKLNFQKYVVTLTSQYK
jgi:hypothetical protein